MPPGYLVYGVKMSRLGVFEIQQKTCCNGDLAESFIEPSQIVVCSVCGTCCDVIGLVFTI